MTRREYATKRRDHYFHLWLSAASGSCAERRYLRQYEEWDRLIGFMDYMKHYDYLRGQHETYFFGQ